MSKGIFITGTGTDVGKTYVTGLIVKKLHDAGKKAAYYKAAMSGNEKDSQGKLIPGDAVSVKNISGIEQSIDTMCPMYMRQQCHLIWHRVLREIRLLWKR